MKAIGIRRAKTTLSALVRGATAGECSLITDNRKPVAMIGPPPTDPPDAEGQPPAASVEGSLTDAAAFRDALLSPPHPLELDF